MTMEFSVQVAKHVLQENLAKDKSVVCSPASIDAVLSMVAVGAVNKTQEQFLKLLGHHDIPELKAMSTKLASVFKAPQTSYVNAMWLDQRYSLKPEFEKVLKDVHHARVRVVDFVNQRDQVVNEANAWAEEATKGLIKQIITRNNIKVNTALLLANALYFKGKWQKPFERIFTKDCCFNLLNRHKVRVPFMNQSYKYFDYGVFNECQVIRMPYKSKYSFDDDDNEAALKNYFTIFDNVDRCGTFNQKKCGTHVPYHAMDSNTKTFSMYVFLPFEKDGLPSVMENIKIDQNMFKDELKLDNVMVHKLAIPKFKFESDMDLKNTMKQLGLTLPFDKNCTDFSGIIDSGLPCYISDIFQKCCVETDELGTEAAAVTTVVVSVDEMSIRMKSPSQEIRFVADHPFLFIIREDVSGAILFVGTMLNPK